jgi:hypothetical protein
MKKLIVTLFLSLICFTSICEASEGITNSLKKIELKRGSVPSTRSFVSLPINLFQDETELEVAFLANIGTVHITINDAFGVVVYQEIFDTSLINHTRINLSSLTTNASYTISFIYLNSTVYGEIEI